MVLVVADLLIMNQALAYHAIPYHIIPSHTMPRYKLLNLSSALKSRVSISPVTGNVAVDNIAEGLVAILGHAGGLESQGTGLES